MNDLDSLVVRGALRSDVVGIVLGILLSGLGAASGVLYRLRKSARQHMLLWFGLFAGMYGLRLLVTTSVVPFLAVPIPRPTWVFVAAWITYSIPIPILLFVRELLPDWRPSIRWLLWIQSVFALSGIACDLILGEPATLHVVNNVLIVMLAVGGTTALFRRRAQRQLGIEIGILIFVCTALLANLGSLGVIRLQFDPEPFGFTILLGVLGRLTASRVIGNEERLRLLDQELEIARKIQTMILPRESPRVPGISIATRYLPMTAVAGDFYDFLVMNEHRVGVLVADVSGHGVPAALIASMVKIAIASQLPHADDPTAVLSGINQALVGKFKGQFVTAAYLYVDLKSRVMRYGSAGHPPLLWLDRENGKVSEITENGLALGMRAKSTYKAVEREIGEGDRFLLYTDGLIEARNVDGEQFGGLRLAGVLADSTGLETEAAASAALERLSVWTGVGKAQEDDLTLAVVDLGRL